MKTQQLIQLEREKILVLTMLLLITLSLMTFVQATTLDELLNSYSFDYDGGIINVSNVADSINGNVLSFNINITNVTSGDYTFYIDVDDVGGIVSGKRAATVSSVGNFQVNLSTYLLSGAEQFNYTLRIYNSNDSLIFKKARLPTQTYSSYDSGHEILGISDSNQGNNYIRINASINSSIVSTENVSIFLEYGSSTVSVTNEESLSSGVNYILFELDNETIKGTHYVGTYNVTGISIGEKLIPYNYTTSSYDYEDFAKTSYIKSYNSSFVDTGSDNLTDYVEFNFTINAKQSGTYTVGADIYDLYGQYLTTINESDSLSVGEGVIQAKVNGTLLYSLGVDGPYLIGFSRLSYGGSTVDSQFDGYTTNITSYYDFERPPRPDLTVSLYVEGNEINATVQNIGSVAASNVQLDIFDDGGYDTTLFYDSLNASDQVIFNTTSNSTGVNITIAVVDFYNYIDEENESNNLDSFTLVPTTILISPENGSLDTDGEVTFNCSATDDTDLENITLYGNWGGGWHANETKSLSGNSDSATFTKTLEEGSYEWNCLSTNVYSNSDWADDNWTLNVSYPSTEISLDVVYPFENVNVTQNEFFNVTVNVTCRNGDCGEINVSLDPSSIDTTMGNLGATTRDKLKDKDYHKSLRETDSFRVRNGDYYKSFDSSEKKLTIEDSEYGVELELKLLSDYEVQVPAGENTMVAEMLLVNWNRKDLFDSINTYDIKRGYSNDYRNYWFKYSIDYEVEECFDPDRFSLEPTNSLFCENITKTNWTRFDSLDDLPNKDIKIGLFTDTIFGEKMEWVPVIDGFEVLEYAAWDVTTGTRFEFDNSSEGYNSLAKIDDTHYLVTYTGANDDGYATVLVIDGTNISMPEDPFEFDNDTGYYNSLAKIDDTHYLNTYMGTGWEGYAVILEVNGTTVSKLGDPFEFETVPVVAYNSLIKVNNTHYLNAYRGPDNDGYATVLVVNGTTVSKPGISFEFDPLFGDYNSLAKIDDTHYLNTYRGEGSDGYAVVLVVSGNSVYAPESPFEFDSTNAWGNSLAKIDDTHYLNTYSGPDNDGYAVILEVNGTTVSKPGISFEFDTNIGYHHSLTKVDDTHYLNVYTSNGSEDYAVILEVNGTNISIVGSPFEFDNGGYNSLAKIDDTHYLNVYTGTGSEGYAIVLTVESPVKSGLISTILGSTPFYTNESNPRAISLNENESQLVTFWVNATGSMSITHEFFAFANLTSNPSISNITNKWNVTIVGLPDTTLPSINFVSPTPDNGTTLVESSIPMNISTFDDSSHYAFADFDDSLVLWMRMDDVAGTAENPIDLSSYSNNGTLINDAFISSGGKFGDALNLDGSGDYVEIPDDDSLDLSNNNLTTISMWIKPNSSIGSYPVLYSKYVSDSNRHVMFLDSTGSYELYFTPRDQLGTPANTPVQADVWQYVAVVYNGTTAIYYYNGSYDGQNVISPLLGVGDTGNVQIGAQNGILNFDGMIDEVLVFDRDLSAEEIASLYDAQANQYFNNFTGLSDGTHSFRGHAVDTSANMNSTEKRTVSVDTTPPAYSNLTESPEDPAVYSPGQFYEFNSTWIDNLAVSSVTFESGGVNYSTINRGNDVYSINFTNLPAGIYSYRWHATDTSGNINYTEEQGYTIVSAEINLSITNPTIANPKNVSSDEDISINFDLLEDGNNITSNVSIENVTIGGVEADIVGGSLPDYNATVDNLNAYMRLPLSSDAVDVYGNLTSGVLDTKVGNATPVPWNIPNPPTTNWLNFDGDDGWDSTADDTNINTYSNPDGDYFAMSVWFNASVISDTNNGQVLWGQGGSINSLTVYVTDDFGYDAVFCTATEGANIDYVSAPINPNQIYHLGCIWDFASGEINMWLNGTLVDTDSSLAIGVNLGAHSMDISLAQQDQDTIDHNGDLISGFWQGQIGDLVYWGVNQDDAVSGENFSTIYNNGMSEGEQEFGYVDGLGWQVNVTVPDFADGFQDLFVSANYNEVTYNDTEIDAINYINPKAIFNFSLLNVSNLDAVFEFRILDDSFPQSLFPWSFDFGNGNSTDSSLEISLSDSEDIFVIIENNYSSSGNYNVTVNTTVGYYNDVETLEVSI